MVAWGDSKYSSSDDEQKETMNICFMAREDEVPTTSLSNSEINIDELFDAYNELIIDFKKLNKSIKEANSLNEKSIIN